MAMSLHCSAELATFPRNYFEPKSLFLQLLLLLLMLLLLLLLVVLVNPEAFFAVEFTVSFTFCRI